MTKAELEIKVKELEKEIKDMKHLSQAVDAKDKEMNDLIEKHQEHINQIEDKKEKEINSLIEKHQKEVDAINETNEKNLKVLNENNEKQRNELISILKRRESELNRLINIFGNTLKALQGSLDNAIELNEYFVNEVKA